MTLLENIKLFLALVDEYDPTNKLLTTDEDIQLKCKLLYGTSYQELANKKTFLKLKSIDITKGSVTGYEENSLPKCKQVKRIIALDENNNKINADYYFLGEKIYISNKENAKYVIEYIPYLSVINDETEDDFELEIPQDLQDFLPYMVAYDLFMTDPAQDNSAFMVVYNRKLQQLTTSSKGISANITEGDL